MGATQPVRWAATPSTARSDWTDIAAAAPQMAATMERYLVQAGTFLAPRSIEAARNALGQLARWLLDHSDATAVVDVTRNDIEDFKVWLADQPGIRAGTTMAANSQRQRLRMLRVFFERIIEWDWPDAPARNPIIGRDIPPRPEPLPRFLDDQEAARFMVEARAATDPRDRVIVEVLARTGLRVGELVGLEPDAIVQIGDGHWLRVPLGKLRNDRYVPLHPDLVTLLATWTAENLGHIRRHHQLLADHRGQITRDAAARIVRRIGRRAGITNVTPHRLRHTLATQAINRGMRLEAIAALLGHRSLEMTLTYARIANRVVAEEYQAISTQLDALYGQDLALAADFESTTMSRLRREAHARMLGNGLCTRPVELECRMESACETCAYFRTGPDFVPVLIRQRDHAKEHGQTDRAEIFDNLLTRVDQEGS